MIRGSVVADLFLQLHDIGFALDDFVLSISHVLIELYVLLDSLYPLPYGKAVLIDELQPMSYIAIFALIQKLNIVQDVIVIEKCARLLHS